MAVDANATRRQRIFDALADGASRTFSRTVQGVSYSCTLSNPQIRTLNGGLVLSIDVSLTRNGVLVYEDRLNQPNPPQAVVANNGTVSDNPLQALRNTIADVARAATNDWTTPFLRKSADGTFAGDTLAVRSTSADGRVTSTSAAGTWAAARNGTSLAANTTTNPHEVTATLSGADYSARQWFFDFDTSSLGSGATLSNGVFTLYGTGTAETNTDSLDMQFRPYNWGGTVTTADWIDTNPTTGWTNLTLMGHFSVASWNQTNNTANNFTVDSYADISKTAVTYVVMGMSALGSTTAPTGVNSVTFYNADNTGTSSDPLLTVTYTPAITGTIAATLQKALFSGSGTQTQTGTIAATLQAATAALTGEQTFTGTAAATMQAATFSGSGDQSNVTTTGTITSAMQAATASMTGQMEPSGALASTMQPATFSGAAAQILAGAIAAELQKATFSGSGTQTIAGTIAAELTKALFSGAGAQSQTGTITAELQEPTATLVGVMQPSGTIVSTLAYPLFSGTATVGNTNMAYSVYIDLDGTILLSDDTDVAGNVIGEGRGVGNVAVHVERGHDVARVLSPPVAGLARFTLDNVDGTYDIGTDLRAGLLTRVEATYLSTRYPLFTGILDHPTRSQPDVRLPYVTVEVLGRLSRLAGINVSTGLYADITTSTAIGYLLDAAGFPKNAPAYLDSLTPAGGWNLASTSGDDPDASGNGNDAVITLGSGVRGDTAIEDGGTLSTDFDGANTRFAVAAASAINNHFATGGLTLAFINADSDGESDTGLILSKGYEFYVSDQSGSAMRLQFVQGFSTTAGSWRTTDRVITVGTNYLVAVYYDRTTGTSADPTMWVCDLDAETYTKLTVGSGLTEVSTPSGTVTTDTATGLQIGGASGGSRCFDGNISAVRVYGDVGDVTYWEPLIKTASVRASNAPRHIDDGLTTMDWWWLDNEDALQALETLKNTEGPGAALYEDATGALVFKNRHARSTEARSSTVQTTFTDSTEPRPSSPLTYDPGLKDVINRCEIEVVRRSAQALGEVWALGETVIIAAGETKTFIARASDPFQNAVTPSSGASDYTVSTGSLSTISIDRTSGAQVTITLYSASGCTITGLRLRAESVEVVNTTTITHSLDMATSQESYGVSTYRLPTRREIPAPTAQSFTDAVVSYYQEGRPTLRMTVESNFDDDRKTAVLTREVGDRVHVTISDDLNADFWIEHIEHNINTMSVHDTVFSLSEANEVVSYFVLGTSQLNGTDVLTF